ncbi:MAG: YhfC family intramembrane metalloprotease [Anaerolineaceae bacterium]
METNIGLFISYAVTILLMIGVPIALTVIVVRRFKVSWWVILTGVVTFLVSQVIHYPVLQLVSKLFNAGTLPVPATQWIPLFNAVILGFLAALFEETARYFGFLIMKKKTKRIESAVGLGIGHGGIESIGFAVWPFFPLFGGALINFFYILFYNAGAQIAKGVSMDQVQYTASQIAQFWTNPWHLGFLPGIERLIAISTQIFLSILIWKAVRSKNFGWFALAFFYHMLVDGIGVFLTYTGWGAWGIEGVLSIFMLANIYLIYYFWKDESDKRKELAEELGVDADELEDDEIEDHEDEDIEDEEDEDEDDLFESVESIDSEEENNEDKPEEEK